MGYRNIVYLCTMSEQYTYEWDRNVYPEQGTNAHSHQKAAVTLLRVLHKEWCHTDKILLAYIFVDRH